MDSSSSMKIPQRTKPWELYSFLQTLILSLILVQIFQVNKTLFVLLTPYYSIMQLYRFITGKDLTSIFLLGISAVAAEAVGFTDSRKKMITAHLFVCLDITQRNIVRYSLLALFYPISLILYGITIGSFLMTLLVYLKGKAVWYANASPREYFCMQDSTRLETRLTTLNFVIIIVTLVALHQDLFAILIFSVYLLTYFLMMLRFLETKFLSLLHYEVQSCLIFAMYHGIETNAFILAAIVLCSNLLIWHDLVESYKKMKKVRTIQKMPPKN